MSETSCPAANHDIGVSMASISLGVFDLGENILPRSRNARSAMRHCKTKFNRPAKTMHDTPAQSVHCTHVAKTACR